MEDLERRALAAATAVAADHGLDAGRAEIIRAGSNVLVHLRPAPVVARVMTGTVALHDDPRTWLTRELSVLAFLDGSGLAVRPSTLVDPGPHRRDGLWMTLVEWLPGAEPIADARPADAPLLGRALRELHRGLEPFDGPLGDMGDLHDDVMRLHARLRPAGERDAAAIAALATRLDRLREAVFASGLATQALHGDVSEMNLLSTRRGQTWNDFEDVLRGPVHWDLASMAGSLRLHGGAEAEIAQMLDAYGWGDRAALEPFLAAQDVYDEIWRRYDRQRRVDASGDDGPVKERA